MCKSNKSIGRFLGIQPDDNIVYEQFWTVLEHCGPSSQNIGPALVETIPSRRWTDSSLLENVVENISTNLQNVKVGLQTEFTLSERSI